MATTVYLEVGKAKTFACSVGWPGWCRSGRNPEAAVEALGEHADRDSAAVEVRLRRGATNFDVVEQWPGGGATDFGALDKPCTLDQRTLDRIAATAPRTVRKGHGAVG